MLADAVRRGQQAGVAARADHLLGEDPLRDEDVVAVEIQLLPAAPAVVRDVVDRHLGPALPAQRGQRLQGVVEQPGRGVVPVDHPGVGAVGDPGERGVAAALVEVVEAQHRQPDASGEPRLPGPRGAGEDDDLSAHRTILPDRRARAPSQAGDVPVGGVVHRVAAGPPR